MPNPVKEDSMDVDCRRNLNLADKSYYEESIYYNGINESLLREVNYSIQTLLN